MSETMDTATEPKRPGGFLDLGDDDICQRASRRYSRVSFALLLLIVVSNIAGIALSVAFLAMNQGDPKALTGNPLLQLVVMFVPMYVIGVPVAWLVMRPMPAKAPKEGKISGGHLLVLFLVSIFFMQAGNIVGTMLAQLFTGGKAQNAIEQLVGMDGWLQFVVITLIAPVIEELVFRKFIIDRTNRFGEKAAILFSALAFALFHTNLFQLFYTFGLGLVLGYMYVRTGKLRLPIIFHVAINALGGIIPILLLRLVEKNAGMSFAQLTALPQERLVEFLGAIIPLTIYNLLMYGAAVAGMILLIIFAKKLRFEPAKDELPKGRAFKAVCINVGFILYFLVCVLLMVLNLLESAGFLNLN